MVTSQKQMTPVTAAIDAENEGEIIIHNEAAPAEEPSARLPRVVNVTFPYVVHRRHRALASQHPSVPVHFRNVPIINASRESRLDVFERADFETLFPHQESPA